MPYVSDKQRRFFHTDTARKSGITPSMVKEYDEATRGKELPQKVEKKVEKKAGSIGPTTTTNVPKYKTEKTTKNNVGQPEPGDYKQNFLESSASAAQRSSSDKFDVADKLTMPITR